MSPEKREIGWRRPTVANMELIYESDEMLEYITLIYVVWLVSLLYWELLGFQSATGEANEVASDRMNNLQLDTVKQGVNAVV